MTSSTGNVSGLKLLGSRSKSFPLFGPSQAGSRRRRSCVNDGGRWASGASVLGGLVCLRPQWMPSRPRSSVSAGVVDAPAKLAAAPPVVELEVAHFFRQPLLGPSAEQELLRLAQTKTSSDIVGLKTEQCFNVGLTSPLSADKLAVLRWLLGETFEPEKLKGDTFLHADNKTAVLVEVGPRLSFTTAWSTNAVSICQSCSLTEVARLERSRRYLLSVNPGSDLSLETIAGDFAALVHDRMTECVYANRLRSFEASVTPAPVVQVPVMEEGRQALEKINEQMGLAFDEQDLLYYIKLFSDDIGLNPTTVELFDIAQSNSEHIRHWFFNGKLVIDGESAPRTLFQIVESPWKINPANSVIGFNDNSSAIRGCRCSKMLISGVLSSDLCNILSGTSEICFVEVKELDCSIVVMPF